MTGLGVLFTSRHHGRISVPEGRRGGYGRFTTWMVSAVVFDFLEGDLGAFGQVLVGTFFENLLCTFLGGESELQSSVRRMSPFPVRGFGRSKQALLRETSGREGQGRGEFLARG